MLGLCICYYNHNYGSMLQAYATVAEMRGRGLDYEIIGYKKKLTLVFILKNLPRIMNRTWQNEKGLVVQKKINRLLHKKFACNAGVRDQLFVQFRNTHFDSLVHICHGYDDLVQQAQRYDAALVGSDQMWSPSGLATNFYNLMFVPDGVRKISYASSFGVSSIPDCQRKRTRAYLSRIDYLSVRETSGQTIVKELTGRDALIAVDPTLLLSREDWDVFSKEEKVVKYEYIFAYFLGDNQEHREKVRELAEATGLKVVTLRHLDQYVPFDEQFGDYAPYDVGPCEFLNLIKNAVYVCTDSFHGSVFSAIFHKKFLTFPRYRQDASVSRNSRIESLIDHLGLQERFYKGGDVLKTMEGEIDYTAVDGKKEVMVNRSKAFLDEALSEVRKIDRN